MTNELPADAAGLNVDVVDRLVAAFASIEKDLLTFTWPVDSAPRESVCVAFEEFLSRLGMLSAKKLDSILSVLQIDTVNDDFQACLPQTSPLLQQNVENKQGRRRHVIL